MEEHQKDKAVSLEPWSIGINELNLVHRNHQRSDISRSELNTSRIQQNLIAEQSTEDQMDNFAQSRLLALFARTTALYRKALMRDSTRLVDSTILLFFFLSACIALVTVIVVRFTLLARHREARSSPAYLGRPWTSSFPSPKASEGSSARVSLPPRPTKAPPPTVQDILPAPSAVPSAVSMHSHQSAYPGSSESLESSPAGSFGDAMGMLGMPLCPSLLIPDNTNLACIHRRDVRNTRQSLFFDVCSWARTGRRPLFKVLVAENSPDNKPGIYLQDIDGGETLAFLSTQELWSKSSEASVQATLGIYRASGVLYGSIAKSKQYDEFTVMRGQTPMLTLSGDFWNYDIKATASNGRVIAIAKALSPDECQVLVQAKVDTGLVFLALLAADKFIHWRREENTSGTI